MRRQFAVGLKDGRDYPLDRGQTCDMETVPPGCVRCVHRRRQSIEQLAEPAVARPVPKQGLARTVALADGFTARSV